MILKSKQLACSVSGSFWILVIKLSLWCFGDGGRVQQDAGNANSSVGGDPVQTQPRYICTHHEEILH